MSVRSFSSSAHPSGFYVTMRKREMLVKIYNDCRKKVKDGGGQKKINFDLQASGIMQNSR